MKSLKKLKWILEEEEKWAIRAMTGVIGVLFANNLTIWLFQIVSLQKKYFSKFTFTLKIDAFNFRLQKKSYDYNIDFPSIFQTVRSSVSLFYRLIVYFPICLFPFCLLFCSYG